MFLVFQYFLVILCCVLFGDLFAHLLLMVAGFIIVKIIELNKFKKQDYNVTEILKN